MDFLNDFDPSSSDEDEVPKEKSSNFPPFSSNKHDKFWYREASKENQTATAINEIELFQVADFYNSGNFEAAEKILTNLRENTKNNRTHEIMLIDSVLQCFTAKKEDFSESQTSCLCSRLLFDYLCLLVDFGDQIQFLRTKALILSQFPLQQSSNFRHTMALLCQLCGSSENWLIFENGAKFFSDLEMYGLKAKMAKVLHYEIQHSRGFVKENLERKWKRVKEEEHVLEGKLSKEDIDLVLRSLTSHKDVISLESAATSSVFRAHESRSKNKLIPLEDQPAVISDFFARYQFLSPS